MVNVPGRSRGCANCRRRKVKCDQSLPECRRCVDMGLRCPRARTEAFFVYAIPSVPPGDQSSSSATTSMVVSRSPGVRVLDDQRLWKPPAPQPSRADAFDQLFVSHFIESFFGSMKPPTVSGVIPPTWLHELPRFLASPTPFLAKNSIRATCMLSYGTQVQDPSIRTEACRWYARALKDLRFLLSKGPMSFDESAVCATTMLIHFEASAGTCRKAWLQHVKGATMMLEAVGPEHCRSGFMHQIFSHLRLQMFVAAMVENEPHPFASPRWMTIPFEVHPKTIFDVLVDNLFSVQRCLVVADRLIRSHEEQGKELKAKLTTLVLDSMSQLNCWWSQCKSIVNTGEGARIRFQPGDDAVANLVYDSDSFAMLPFSDIPSAALASLYSAANMVVFRLYHLVSSSAALCGKRARQHARSILAANEFISSRSGSVPDRGSIMMVLQLKIVSLWSPSQDHRATARRILQEEKVQSGGFADMSADSHDCFAGVAAYIFYQCPGD